MEYDIEKILTMYEDDYNPSSMVPGPRNMFADGQLVRNTVDGSRPGYQGPKYSSSHGTPGVRLNPKELKNIQDDLVNFDGLNLSKRGNSYYIRFRLQKGDNIISKQLTATPENIALFKKEQKVFMKTNYPNVLSNADFEQLRMLDENINLTAPEFTEVLNNKKKTTINGLPWTKDTVQKLQGDLQLNDVVRPEFKGKKRKINVAKKIVRDNNPAELKRLNEIPDIDLRNKAIRKKASDITGHSSQLQKTGTLQGITKNREGSLWKNYYESSKKNNRIKLGGTFNGKDLSFRKNWPRKVDGSINWFIKDTKTNKPAWQMLEFTDTQTPKGEVKFTYDGLQNQVDDAFGKGYFARSTNAYSSGRELYGKNIMFEGKMQPIGRVIAKQTVINNYKANNNGKVPTEKYIQDRIRIHTPTQVHHTEGIGNNPYKVQLVSRDANQKLNAAELTYNGEIRKAKGDPTKIKSLNSEFKKTINQISNDYGGIKYDVDGTTVGKAATGESMYTSAVKESGMNKTQKSNFLKLFKDVGIPCIKGVGGNCTTPEDFRKGFNQLVKEGAGGDKLAVSKMDKFTKSMRKLKGAATWTGYGLLAEAGFMVPFAVGDYAAGESWKRIIGNATDYGFGPILGQSEQEQFEAALPEGSKAVEGEKAIELSEQLHKLDEQEFRPQGRIGMDQARKEKSRENVITGITDEFKLNLDPFLSDTPFAKDQWHQGMWTQAHQDAADARAQIAKENFERSQKRDITPVGDYFGAATGGRAGYMGGGITTLRSKYEYKK